MKHKFRVFLFLALVSNVANAEWQYLSATDQGVLYVDRSSRQKTGSIIRAWDKVVLNKPSITGTKTQVTLKEIDCKNGTFKNIKMKTYDENDRLTDEHDLWFDTKIKAEKGSIALTYLVAMCT